MMTKSITTTIFLLCIVCFCSTPKITTSAFVSPIAASIQKPNRFAPLSPSTVMTKNILDVATETTDSTSSSSSSSSLEPFLEGVKRDFGNRFPQYRSDIVDGINTQSLATVLFLFFACLAPAVGFGWYVLLTSLYHIWNKCCPL